MAAKAGIVTIDVATDISKLVKGMNRAQSVTKNAVSAMKRLVGAAAIAGAFYKTTKAISSTIDSMDKLAKTATKIGTTSRELSQLRYTADFAGVSMAELDMSMQRLQRRAVEAADGSGAAKDALLGLGIVAKDFADMPLSDKMGLLADKLQGVESETRKLEVAFSLFGREGTGILDMLQNGSKGLKDFAEQSDRAGATIEDKIAKNAEKAKDAFTAFDYAITALTNNLTASVLPAINSTMNAFLDFFNIPRQVGLDEVNKQIVEINDKLKEARESMENSSGYGGIFRGASKRDITELEYELERLLRLHLELKKATTVKPMGGDGYISDTADSVKDLTDTLLPARAALRDMRHQIAALNELHSLGVVVGDEYAEAQAAIVKRYEERIGVGKSINKNTKESIDLTKQLTDVIGSKLENAMMSTFRAMMDGTANFKDTMISFIKDIIAELLRLIVIKNIAEGISGAVTGFDAGVSGSRASGGGVSGGKSYLVGERGAEVFTPSGGGSVSPIGGVNVNINNYAGVGVETTRRGDDIDVMIRKIEPMLADGIRRRTSPLSAAIEGMR